MLAPTLLYVALIGAFFAVYAWSLYNLPILATGVRNLRKSRQMSKKKRAADDRLPTFSIVVPVKNEGNVVGRLLEALAKLDYPKEKQEILIVVDGSTDESLRVCRRFAEQRKGLTVKILQKPSSDGKPSALNFGIKQATGDIVAIFDADNVPAADALLNVSKYFDDPSVAAVQGRTLSINSQENMLTKFISHEEAVWCEAYLGGKDRLNLFVHLRGSCEFIRRHVLESLKGFDENFLSDDMEFSARLAGSGHKIRYALDVRSWQESPSGFRQFFKQRTRWLRGTMQVAFRYGRLMSKPSRLTVDAEATLFGPLILIASLITYFGAVYTAFCPVSLSVILQSIMQLTLVFTTATMLLCGLALIYSTKPRKATSLLWLPFIFFYWSAQAFIALYAILLILLRRPQKWTRTEKKGTINPD